MNILSIQSRVAYGHVGNSCAAFVLQRLGAELWAIDTVMFSNHPGHGAWTGRTAAAADIAALVEGVAARGVLPACDAVLSGYLGSAEIGAVVLETASRVRAANPRAVYACDPVIGDVGKGVYVRPELAEFFRAAAVPVADLLTPNHFELEFLAGGRVTNLADAKAAVWALRARMRPGGPAAILVTSLRLEDTPADSIDLLAADASGFFRVRQPLLPITVSGAGDAVAALFLFHILRGADVGEAMAAAASAIYGVIARTAEAAAPELLLIAAQGELVRPSCLFRVEAV